MLLSLLLFYGTQNITDYTLSGKYWTWKPPEPNKVITQIPSSPKALEGHDPVIEKYLDSLIASLVCRATANSDELIYIVQELKSFTLFSNIFTGEGLLKEQEQQFIDYSKGLYYPFLNCLGSTKNKEMHCISSWIISWVNIKPTSLGVAFLISTNMF